MIPRAIRNKYSCKRKADFVTLFAVTFFFLIVAWELYLIIWVPIQLQHEGVLQKHVAKENMGKLVDGLRSQLRYQLHNTPAKNTLNRGEIQLAVKMLNMYANYARKYQDVFSLNEILEVTELMKHYGIYIAQWGQGKFIFKLQNIALEDGIRHIEKKNKL